MKASRFNVYTGCNDGYLLYNCFTNNLVNINTEQYELFNRCFADGACYETGQSDEKVFIDFIKEGGFIIDDDLDELGKTKISHYINRYMNDGFFITISPTSSCNFSCKYCYQTDKQTVFMTRDTEQLILEYVKSYIARTPSLEHICLNWFGGEPTLALDTVYRLSGEISKLAAEKKFYFMSSFATNGYIMNENIAEKLIENGIKNITVSLDGPPDIHDSRRPLRSGNGSFNAIISNIESVADIISVIICCTVDSENIEHIPGLLDILSERGLSEKVILGIAPTIAFPGTCELVKSSVLSIENYAKSMAKLYPIIMKRGFNMPKNRLGNVYNGCSALGTNAVGFDAEGYMYKCTKTIGIKNERTGHVSDPDEFSKNAVKWMAWDPMSDEKCVNCKVLPLCMGGCPYITIQKEVPEIYEQKCREWKYNLAAYNKALYEYKKGCEHESIKL